MEENIIFCLCFAWKRILWIDWKLGSFSSVLEISVVFVRLLLGTFRLIFTTLLFYATLLIHVVCTYAPRNAGDKHATHEHDFLHKPSCRDQARDKNMLWLMWTSFERPSCSRRENTGLFLPSFNYLLASGSM